MLRDLSDPEDQVPDYFVTTGKKLIKAELAWFDGRDVRDPHPCPRPPCLYRHQSSTVRGSMMARAPRGELGYRVPVQDLFSTP